MCLMIESQGRDDQHVTAAKAGHVFACCVKAHRYIQSWRFSDGVGETIVYGMERTCQEQPTLL